MRSNDIGDFRVYVSIRAGLVLGILGECHCVLCFFIREILYFCIMSMQNGGLIDVINNLMTMRSCLILQRNFDEGKKLMNLCSMIKKHFTYSHVCTARKKIIIMQVRGLTRGRSEKTTH